MSQFFCLIILISVLESMLIFSLVHLGTYFNCMFKMLIGHRQDRTQEMWMLQTPFQHHRAHNWHYFFERKWYWFSKVRLALWHLVNDYCGITIYSSWILSDVGTNGLSLKSYKELYRIIFNSFWIIWSPYILVYEIRINHIIGFI